MKHIKSHSDINFVKGFHRYAALGKINKAESWEELQKVISEEDMKIFFNEFKVQNFTLTIEYQIVTLLEYLYNNNQVKKESLTNIFCDSIKRFQKASSNEEAKEILKNETENNSSHMLTPHVVFYVASLSLSSLIGILTGCVKDFDMPDTLLDKLADFKRVRNLIIHNRLTSRENVNDEIKNGTTLALEIINLMEGAIDVAKAKTNSN
ncbi:MAG: hypothetical protein WC495_04565 [Patescibacteria group bacterium]|jgi:hypothetical protein